MKDHEVMEFIGIIKNEPYDQEALYRFKGVVYKWTAIDLPATPEHPEGQMIREYSRKIN